MFCSNSSGSNGKMQYHTTKILIWYTLFEFKQLIDDMAIDLWSSLNFASMKNI